MPLPYYMHNLYMDYFIEYMIVGGMPSTVKSYLEHNDLGVVRIIQKILLLNTKMIL